MKITEVSLATHYLNKLRKKLIELLQEKKPQHRYQPRSHSFETIAPSPETTKRYDEMLIKNKGLKLVHSKKE